MTNQCSKFEIDRLYRSRVIAQKLKRWKRKKIEKKRKKKRKRKKGVNNDDDNGVTKRLLSDELNK